MEPKMGKKIVSDPFASSVSINKKTSTKPSSSTPKSPEQPYGDSEDLRYPDPTCL